MSKQQAATDTTSESAQQIARHAELREITTKLQQQALRLAELGYQDVTGLVLTAAAKAAKIRPAKA